MANGNLFYNGTRSILYGTVSLKKNKKKKNKKKQKNYRLDVHANERKVPKTYMKDYYYYYYYILDNVSTRNFRMRESVIESLSQ